MIWRKKKTKPNPEIELVEKHFECIEIANSHFHCDWVKFKTGADFINYASFVDKTKVFKESQRTYNLYFFFYGDNHTMIWVELKKEIES